MKVITSRKEMAKFRQRVRQSFPKERIELLWGKMVGRDTFHIFLFDQVKHTATRSQCKTDEDDHDISIQEAMNKGLVVLGTIHSHPGFTDTAPSETDFDDGLEQGEVISGIAAVWKDKKTGRIRTKIRFWGPLLGVTAEYI